MAESRIATVPRTAGVLPEEFWNEYSFKWLFGDTPATRVLQYLLVHGSTDITLRELAKQTHVGYRTFYRYVPRLIDLEVLKVSRTVGPAKLYILNRESRIVRLLEKLASETALKNAEKVASEYQVEEVLDVVQAKSFKRTNMRKSHQRSAWRASTERARK